jgi:hypothetical protein
MIRKAVRPVLINVTSLFNRSVEESTILLLSACLSRNTYTPPLSIDKHPAMADKKMPCNDKHTSACVMAGSR